MKEAQGEGVELGVERDYRMKQKDEKCEEEEQRWMDVGREAKGEQRQEKNSKRMREDSTKARGRTDEEGKVGEIMF